LIREHGNQRMAAVDVNDIPWQGQSKADLIKTVDTVAFHSFTDCLRQFTPTHTVVLMVRLKRSPQYRQCVGDETLYVVLAAQHLLHPLPFRQNIFRVNGLLSKDSTVTFSFVASTCPAHLYLLLYVIQGRNILQPQIQLTHPTIQTPGK